MFDHISSNGQNSYMNWMVKIAKNIQNKGFLQGNLGVLPKVVNTSKSLTCHCKPIKKVRSHHWQ
jgi:hypothetical protein